MDFTIPTEVDTLIKLHNWLDTGIIPIYSPHDFVSIFQKMRDRYESGSIEAIEAQYEIEILSCGLHKNQINFHMSFVDTNGLEKTWPDHDNFSEELFNYLIRRSEECQNLFLKAYYNHFFWLKKREISFAKLAINTYLDVIPSMSVHTETDHHAYLLNTLSNCFYLAKMVKYKVQEVKQLVLTVLKQYPIEKDNFAAVRNHILTLMMEEKTFKKTDFEELPQLCFETARLLVEKNHPHFAITMLHIGQQIDSKHTFNAGFPWYETIGQNWEILIEQAKQNSGLAGATYCREAIKNYKKAGDESKVSELSETLKFFKSNISFASIPMEIPQDYLDAVEEDIAGWLERSCEEILIYLIQSEKLIPTFKNNSSSAEFSFSSTIGTEIVDPRGNSIKYYASDNEKEIRRIKQSYDIELHLIMIFFDKLMFQAISKGKLTANCLLSFLQQTSWFGKQLSKTLVNGQQMQYTWLNQVAPAIHEYFVQMEYAITSNLTYEPNFVTAMDSLTMKFEGIIRDFCEVLNIDIIETKTDSAKRSIEQFKDINRLLREKELESFLGSEETLLLKMILIEQDGENFRNKIGHSLMMPGDYSFRGFNLLLFALLRLAKYDFNIEGIK